MNSPYADKAIELAGALRAAVDAGMVDLGSSRTVRSLLDELAALRATPVGTSHGEH